jgi:TolB-like protein/Tfp pilus assembly protein PilF
LISWDRLKQRKLFQWAAAYMAGAWLVLQVLDAVGGILDLSVVFQRGVLVALGFGLILTLVLAWYHGEAGRQRVSGVELILIAGVLVVAGVALNLLRGSGATGEEKVVAGPGPNPRSVAVLPFVDMSPQGDQEYFGDGIAEELLSTIGQIPDLVVSARTSSFTFKKSDLDVREIGVRLGVATVVEGSIRKSADRLRIEASVIDVGNGFKLWSDRFDAELSDVFAVQERIARAVAEALRVQLSDAGSELRLPGQTDNHEAQDLYLRGRFEWNKRTQASLEKAVEYFQDAIAIDSMYARAFVGLADAVAVLGFYDYRRPAAAFPLARETARRALEIETGLAEAHATLAYVALYYDWSWEEAEREFTRSIELNPEYPVAHQWYANCLVAMGRFEQAESEARIASELDPLSLIAHAVIGWIRFYAGSYDSAIELLEESIRRSPTFEQAYLWMGQAAEGLGDSAKASDAIEHVVELSNGSSISRAALAHVRAGQGRPAEARTILDQLEAEGRSGYVPSYEIARAYVGLGDYDTAIGWLERAYREKAHSMAFLAVDPQIAPLADLPGYLDLLRRMNLERH